MVNAQLWTATDIDGVTHTLENYLDDGKAVLVDVSAHWCGPCWGFHNSHAMEKLYEEFGPEGTNDMMVFWIDGSWDPPSTMALLQGGNGSQGNWIEGTTYPKIGPNGQGLDLIDIYLGSATSYSFPTLYRYCPEGGGTSTEFGVPANATWSSLYQTMRTSCSAAFTNGPNDATLFAAEDLKLCPGQAPKVNLHNMGTAALSSATITMMDGATVLSTVNWTGNLARWATVEVEFPDVDVASATNLHAIVSQPNGQGDDNTTGDDQVYPYVVAPVTEVATVQFQLRTDNWATETKWKLYNDNNQVVYQDPAGNYTNNTTYNYWWELNTDDCYRLEVTDTEGDGICCNYGLGYYKLFSNGTLFAEGGEFGSLDKAPFRTGSIVSVEENVLEQGLSVYPNPTNGRLNVTMDLPSATTVNITVMNVLGEVVSQQAKGFGSGQQQITLDLNGIAQGSYMLNVLADGMTATRKITITH